MAPVSCLSRYLAGVLLMLSLQTSLAIQRSGTSRSGLFQISHGRALIGHVIDTHHVTSPFDCGSLCTTNPQCLSYNYRAGESDGEHDVCELNNSTKTLHPASLHLDALYNYYHDEDSKITKSCLDHLRNRYTTSGVYNITHSNGTTFKVRCDLNSEQGSAWTLVFSYARKNSLLTAFCSRSFDKDEPVEENDPNWEAYRLSLSRMQHLVSQSTHWRATTGFPIYGVDYRDYVRGKFSNFDIMNYEGVGICKDVELINIRGIKGVNTQAPFWQRNLYWSLHVDSSWDAKCQYDARSGAIDGENNFGYYCEADRRMNPAFRGSIDNESTTQWWYGGYL